ncbi:lipoprotein, putative [Minicystis rosea]|nr:lipoprotein, putative [Minicystis rosea]
MDFSEGGGSMSRPEDGWLMSWKVLGPIVASVVVSLSTTGCSSQVVVRSAPPAERQEAVAAAPSAQHFWVRGHWHWDGARYDWIAGRWETRRTHEVWVPGHWRQVSGGWVWEEGRWTTR